MYFSPSISIYLCRYMLPYTHAHRHTCKAIMWAWKKNKFIFQLSECNTEANQDIPYLKGQQTWFLDCCILSLCWCASLFDDRAGSCWTAPTGVGYNTRISISSFCFRSRIRNYSAASWNQGNNKTRRVKPCKMISFSKHVTKNTKLKRE